MSIFLDVQEAAAFLKVKGSTIYAWVHQRKIPFRKHGAKLVFERKDLEIWSNSQAVSTYAMFRATGQPRRSLKTCNPTAESCL